MSNKAKFRVYRSTNPKFDASIYPKRKDKIVTTRPEIEMLARMWIECDPNRGGDGFEPDDIMQMDGESDLNGKPRWHWFIPRAEASAAYFKAKGYSLASTGEEQ